MIQTIILGMLGTTEIIIIAAIILLLFGGSKLPKLMKGLGQGMNEFKKGMKEGDTSVNDADEKKKSTEE